MRYTGLCTETTRRLRGVGAVVWLVFLMSGAAWASTDPPEPPSEIVVALDEALDSWSQFTATADLEVVRFAFVVAGPQLQQFVSEARESTFVNPRQLTVHEIRLRRLDARTATVWAEVEVSQPGHIAQTFGWDFDFTLQDGRWLVWTVVAADRPTDLETVAWTLPTSTTPTTSQLAPTSAPTQGGVEVLSDPSNAAGTRIPALSAWVVVVTVVGVAVAGYVAPRLDRRRQ